MNIEIQRVPYEQKSVLRNLMELCQHDYTEFSGHDLNEQGLYGYKYFDHYWTEPTRHPFLVRAAGKIAGFALVRELQEEGEPRFCSIAEFFIVRKYRSTGIGRQVAVEIFRSFPGKWHVAQTRENVAAQAFSKKVISAYTGGEYAFREEEDQMVLEFER